MANTDTSALALGKFARTSISEKEQLILLALCQQAILNLSATKPTTASWNTLMSTTLKIGPPMDQLRDLLGQRVAAAFQGAVNQIGAGIFVATTTSTSSLLSNANYLYGFDEAKLRALCTYLEGRIYQGYL